MDQEFLTVSEFAAAVGVTKQAVYARINKDLTPFVSVIQGQKHISIEASSLFNSQSANNPNAKQIDSRVVDTLLSQLEEKDRLMEQQQAVIMAQSEEISKLNTHILNQSESLTNLLHTQNQLQENYQVLLKQHQELLMVDQRLQPVSNIVASNCCNNVDTEHEQVNPGEKLGFFKRLFGR